MKQVYVNIVKSTLQHRLRLERKNFIAEYVRFNTENSFTDNINGHIEIKKCKTSLKTSNECYKNSYYEWWLF